MQVLSVSTPRNSCTFNTKKRSRFATGLEEDYESHYLKKRLVFNTLNHCDKSQQKFSQQALYPDQQNQHRHQQNRHTAVDPSYTSHSIPSTASQSATQRRSLNALPSAASRQSLNTLFEHFKDTNDAAIQLSQEVTDPKQNNSYSLTSSQPEEQRLIGLVGIKGTSLSMKSKRKGAHEEEENSYTIPNFLLNERSGFLTRLSPSEIDKGNSNTGQLIVYKKNPLLPEYYIKQSTGGMDTEHDAEQLEGSAGQARITEVTDEEAEVFLQQQKKEESEDEEMMLDVIREDEDAMDID